MDVSALLARFDEEVRARPSGPGVTAEKAHGAVLLTGAFNFVSAWAPGIGEPDVRALAQRFLASRGELLWRVYEHDGPAGLPAWLASAGFQPSSPGTLMFFDLETDLATGAPAGVEVIRVTNLPALDDFVRASNVAFGDDQASQRRDSYTDHLEDPGLGLYVAYLYGQPVASARLQTAAGRSFGLLFGGGVAPEHRGRGVYRALVAARADEARRQGLTHLSTEARETSRPILERLGFVAAGREVTWALRG